MCAVSSPKPKKIADPVFVRNPFLDEDPTDASSPDALRRGRSSLVIPTDASFGGRGGVAELDNGNGRSRATIPGRPGSGFGGGGLNPRRTSTQSIGTGLGSGTTAKGGSRTDLPRRK